VFWPKTIKRVFSWPIRMLRMRCVWRVACVLRAEACRRQSSTPFAVQLEQHLAKLASKHAELTQKLAVVKYPSLAPVLAPCAHMIRSSTCFSQTCHPVRSQRCRRPLQSWSPSWHSMSLSARSESFVWSLSKANGPCT
jgi:hypothetical protein